MKIAILASGTTLDNFKDHSTEYVEVWGCNQQATMKNLTLDKCFIMDDLKYRMPYYGTHDFTEWLKDYKQPIVTSKKYEEWPTSEEYPIVEICQYFGLPLGICMYSTPDYMIALAIYKGAEQIDVFGVDRCGPGPDEMKMATAGWMMVAHARKVLVNTFPGSIFQFVTNPGIMMEHGLYGYVGRPRIEDLNNPDYFPAQLKLREKHESKEWKQSV